MTRLSSYFLPTVKEAPADAEAVSHQLLVRAGLARQVGAGLWTLLPAGWRAHRRVEQIIREELDAIGAGEMLMPVLQPAELWKRTGRYEIDELFKLQGPPRRRAGAGDDARGGHHLPRLARGALLPRPAASCSTTSRQGARRAAAARRRAAHARVHHEGLLLASTATRRASTRSYELHIEAYDRIFDRTGLEWYRVERDVGMMGGIGAHEYMAPCAAGENEVALSDAGYAANVEIASADAAAGRRAARGAGRARARWRRPAPRTIDAVPRAAGRAARAR